MSKARSSAAIVGLLDALKSEGVEPLSDGYHETKNQEKAVSFGTEASIAKNPSVKNFKDIEYVVQRIPTQQCTSWYMANRLQRYINEESCQDLIESIKTVGQKVPTLVRPTSDSKFEVICGARRLFTCIHLGVDLLAAVVELTDKEALLAMDAENRPRQDISPYERALDYQKWIESGIYKNHNEICAAIGMKKSLFSQVIALGNLNPTVIAAFKQPANLSLKWGYELARYAKNPVTEQQLIKTAEELIQVHLPAKVIYQRLKAAVTSSPQAIRKSNKPLQNPEWITNAKQHKICQIKQNRNGETGIVFHKDVPADVIQKIIETIKGLATEKV